MAKDGVNDRSRVLAVVGSVFFVDPDWETKAELIIREEIERYAPTLCVSGGAIGIDTLFRQIAFGYGYDRGEGNFIEHLPKHRRWKPDGFQARNILVAQQCDRLVAIRCHASKTYGSGWTHDYAKKIGKTTRMEII